MLVLETLDGSDRLVLGEERTGFRIGVPVATAAVSFFPPDPVILVSEDPSGLGVKPPEVLVIVTPAPARREAMEDSSRVTVSSSFSGSRTIT